VGEHYTFDVRANMNSTSIRVLTACRIALRYSKRNLTAKDLIRDFGMSRACAYRWVSAMNEARLLEGMAASPQIPRCNSQD
jgi:transposase